MPNPANPQDLNRYAYTRNNPVVYVDPNGHFPWLLIPVLVVTAIVLTHDAQPPLAVRYEDTFNSVSEGTEVPAIAVAAGVEIQAPGAWDDFASTAYKCSGSRGCDPSVGISQIRPSEVERFTGEVGDRREVVDRLQGDNEFSIQMMHAKLSDARARFETVSQRVGARPTATDYFVMYAIAQNGLSDRNMELAMTEGWGALLRSEDDAAEWDANLFYGCSRARNFVREFVKNLRWLQSRGYELPAGVDLEYLEQLGRNS